MLTEGNLTSMITQGRIQPDEPCVAAMYKQVFFRALFIQPLPHRAPSPSSSPPRSLTYYHQFKQVQMSTPLSDLALIFDRDHYALVVAEQRCYNKGKPITRSVVAGVVTRIDLLNFISRGTELRASNGHGHHGGTNGGGPRGGCPVAGQQPGSGSGSGSGSAPAQGQGQALSRTHSSSSVGVSE